MNTGPVLVDVAVKDLSGAALDWVVATVEQLSVMPAPCGSGWVVRINVLHGWKNYRPSTDWSDGGPLLHKYKACFAAYDYGYLCLLAHNDLHHGQGKGPDHLTAACRAIVAAILGDIVKVPHCLVMP